MAGHSKSSNSIMRPDNAEVLKALKSRKKIDGPKTPEGRIDLRGLFVPRTGGFIPKEAAAGAPETTIRKYHFDNVDFTGADFMDARFVRCVFTNCLFEKTVPELVKLKATQIKNCRFINANLNGASFDNIGNDAGLIHNTRFIKTDLRYTSFSFPIITETVFDHCKMNEVNFDSSRFTNCIFKGKLGIVWFRGYSRHWRPGIRQTVHRPC